LNATQKGKEICAQFVRDGYIDVNGRRISTYIEDIDTITLIDLGHEVAMQHFRTEEAIEAFVMGWSVFGLSRDHTMRSEAQDSKEAHVDAMDAMPSNVIQFRTRR
jgi:hypothetical protein